MRIKHSMPIFGIISFSNYKKTLQQQLKGEKSGVEELGHQLAVLHLEQVRM